MHRYRGSATTSPYRTDDGRTTVGRRLAAYAVLSHDSAVPAVAADYWTHSSPVYQRVLRAWAEAIGRDPSLSPAYRRLAEFPDDVAAEESLASETDRVLDRLPVERRTLWMVLDRADDEVFIRYHRGGAFQAGAEAFELKGLLERSRWGLREPAPAPDVHVVVTLRDTGQGDRVRNLLACVSALRDQSLAPGRYTVTVVESDRPWWRHIVSPRVDQYIHLSAKGFFNKSWAMNAGVRHGPVAPVLCLLDADILADRRFLERNLERFADPSHDAHLPHTEMLSLDPSASNRAIERRCVGGGPSTGLDEMRGLLLRDVPGACLWVRSPIFQRIGGFDERFEGWGGEDDDILVRLTSMSSVAQYDDVLVHLAHRRPAMSLPDGRPFNAGIPIGTWTGTGGFGALTGPATEPERR
ncbi:glycosyltransferase [Mangrovihabitans endophyticus]|nr:galactosyltransferase-related protein [Mangrovihabitans endophyticus]